MDGNVLNVALKLFVTLGESPGDDQFAVVFLREGSYPFWFISD